MRRNWPRVMAHETAHVCAHHGAREMTRMDYAQLGMIPLIMMTGYSWTGYGIYEAAQFAIPVAFLKFSRGFEAQADYLGVQYLYRAGYDPAGLRSDFFEKLDRAAEAKTRPLRQGILNSSGDPRPHRAHPGGDRRDSAPRAPNTWRTRRSLSPSRPAWRASRTGAGSFPAIATRPPCAAPATPTVTMAAIIPRSIAATTKGRTDQPGALIPWSASHERDRGPSRPAAHVGPQPGAKSGPGPARLRSCRQELFTILDAEAAHGPRVRPRLGRDYPQPQAPRYAGAGLTPWD